MESWSADLSEGITGGCCREEFIFYYTEKFKGRCEAQGPHPIDDHTY